jgi:hypothetical protein
MDDRDAFRDVEALRTLRDIDYRVFASASSDMLGVEVEERHSGDRWRGQFAPKCSPPPPPPLSAQASPPLHR